MSEIEVYKDAESEFLYKKNVQYRDHTDLIPLLHAMKDYGGSFASKLADAWFKADLENSKKLKESFFDLLITFEIYLGK